MLDAVKDREGIILLVGTTLAAGALHWTVPYGEVDYTGARYLTTWMIIAVIAGFLGATFLRKSTKHSTMLVTMGFLLTVLLRVAYGGFQDPTSHNLFPFELMITLAIALPPAFIGAWLGNMLLTKEE
jgi:nitrate/nitrite transporter NarK